MIAALKPGFVRFPGGCVVEAGTVETAYNWKLTTGPVESREERWGPWNYRRTQGMGIFEYLQFCDDLGAEPLYVGFCGQTCIFRQREQVPMDQMDWVRENFLDLVEYANGATDSRPGAMRAEAGHAAPFELRQIEIGNENQGREFAERYRFVYDALKAKYPSLNSLRIFPGRVLSRWVTCSSTSSIGTTTIRRVGSSRDFTSTTSGAGTSHRCIWVSWP